MSGTHERDKANQDPGELRAAMAERVGQWAAGCATCHVEGLQQAQRMAEALAGKAQTEAGTLALLHLANEIQIEIARRTVGGVRP